MLSVANIQLRTKVSVSVQNVTALANYAPKTSSSFSLRNHILEK